MMKSTSSNNKIVSLSLIAIILIASSSLASSGSSDMNMKPLKMPQLQEQGTYVVTGHENWKLRTGFGKNEAMVGMMSQMMVGKSGMEGMKMDVTKMEFGDKNYTDDGNDDGNATNPSPVMPGMSMPANSDAATASAPIKSAPLKIIGTIANAASGDNVMSLAVTDSKGAPVTGARIAASVAMTSMDMGTSHPQFTEIGKGVYHSTVNFGMSGPWRVTVKVTPPNGAPQTATFDFDAK